jgi:hypothetical protein
VNRVDLVAVLAFNLYGTFDEQSLEEQLMA